MVQAARSAKRILWVDDEVDLLKPHVIFLQARGSHVDAIANGDDALALLRDSPYDLVLLDEQMPGRRGLAVLEMLRRDDPNARVVMISKSEEDRTMTEAIGRRVDDYLVKPTSPRQVLSVVTRILEGSSIRQQQTAQDFAARFGQLSRKREDATTASVRIADRREQPSAAVTVTATSPGRWGNELDVTVADATLDAEMATAEDYAELMSTGAALQAQSEQMLAAISSFSMTKEAAWEGGGKAHVQPPQVRIQRTSPVRVAA